MASPWKLLARLVSPRRLPKEENNSTGDVTPEMSTVDRPTAPADDEGLRFTDRPAGEELRRHDQSGARSGELQEQGAPVIEGAKPLEAANSVVSDDTDVLAYDASRPSQTRRGATRKRGSRSRKAETGVVRHESPGVPALSDEAMSLDKEISLLREQLANKLQLQNAQLKRMLARFER